MIKRILLWLISIYIKPTPAETKTIPEVENMTDQVVDTVVDQQPVVETVTADVEPKALDAVVTSPLDAEKSAFAKLVAFVEHGVESFGNDAEAELVALAKKYL